jgi:hypothetical protein
MANHTRAPPDEGGRPERGRLQDRQGSPAPLVSTTVSECAATGVVVRPPSGVAHPDPAATVPLGHGSTTSVPSFPAEDEGERVWAGGQPVSEDVVGERAWRVASASH